MIAFIHISTKKKIGIFNISLTREILDGNDRISVNPEAVVKVVRKQMLSECDSMAMENR